jgi:hypothetical protein
VVNKPSAKERVGVVPTLDRWLYDNHTYAALNDVSLAMIVLACTRQWEEFAKGTLTPLIEKARADAVKPGTILTWSSRS